MAEGVNIVSDLLHSNATVLHLYATEVWQAANPEAAKLLGKKTASSETDFEAAAWFTIANILLNLDETITKE